MSIIIFYIGISIAIGMLAARFNRNPLRWIVLSILISPILAGIFLLVVGKKQMPVQDDYGEVSVTREDRY